METKNSVQSTHLFWSSMKTTQYSVMQLRGLLLKTVSQMLK